MTTDDMDILLPPYRIKMVERISQEALSRDYRAHAIERAGHNTFLLNSEDVLIDLLTDSGTNAMYDTQWARMFEADEAYAGAKSSEAPGKFKDTVREYYGLPLVLPTHQGRAAEFIVNQILVRPGMVVLSNMYFTTSREHAELAGAEWLDVAIAEAHDPESAYPWKGNIDLEKCEALIREHGPERVAYIRHEACMNMAGGQPFSMENLHAVRELAHRYGIPFFIDATRAMENAYFVKVRDPNYARKTIKEILYEMCTRTDWLIASAKKDACVNIGGFLATRDEEKFPKAEELLIRNEGFTSYGGLSGRDLEAVAEGIKQAATFEHLRYRVAQVHGFGKLLQNAGIPLVVPLGGHAIYVNAKKFLPHIPQTQYPAQALAAEIYVDSGVRGMERGLASAGRDAKTGEEHIPALELVRLTVPRLVYMKEHFEFAAEGIARTWKRRNEITGLRMVYEPKTLRFFKARFEKL